MRASSRRPLLLIAAVLAACGRGGARSASAGAAAGSGESARSPAAAPAAVSADEWSKSEVVKRLTEAGLVVIDSGRQARHPGLHVGGSQLHLGDGELEIYLYPDVAARHRDAAGIDTTGPALPSIYAPHYIMSGNLIAILHTPHERTADRVQDVLTARHAGGGA